MFRFATLYPVALWLLGTLLFLCGCSKGSDPAVVTTGSIKGQVLPAGAASAVTATLPDGQLVATAPSASTGEFVFADLAVGTYRLGAVPTARYNTPTAVPVTVERGATATASLQLSRDYRIRGTMTWDQNGTTYSAATFYGDIKSNFFSLEGNTALSPNKTNQNVNFVLPFAGGGNPTPFAGVGTYPVGMTQVPWAGCSFYTQGSVDQYSTYYAGRQMGQVVVTRFDANAGIAAGTFSFVALLNLNNSGTGTPTQTITNGRFDITF